MKKLLYAALLLVLTPLVAHGQYSGGVLLRPYASVADAVAASALLDAGQQSHAMIVPNRIIVSPTGYGYPDQMTVSIVVQPLSTEDSTCAGPQEGYLPPQTFGSFPACETFLSGWEVHTYYSWSAMVTAYGLLDARVQKTAYLISTVATNAPYALMSQTFGIRCP